MTQATIHAAAAFIDVPVEHMMSDSHKLRPARARHLAAYVFRHRDKLSYSTIAKLMGRKDHSTVISSVWVVEKLIVEDEAVAAWIAQELALPDERAFQTAEGKVIPPKGKRVRKSRSKAARKPTPAPTLLKTVKVKNEPVFTDKNARMILHGTFKLERALLQAMAERCQRGIAA